MTSQRPRALIVEDNRAWQQILNEMLTDMGLAVDLANSLTSAVDQLRAVPHRLAVVDLALGDGDVNNQDGLSVLDAIRSRDPGCVTLMLTGFATVEIAVRVLNEFGAFTCLRKETFDRTEFRRVVSQALVSTPPLDTGRTQDTTISQNDTQPEQEEPNADQTPSGHVLVVEDDAGWRSILSELLRDAGYEVRLCSSYGEALGHLRRETFTLAIIDLSLAGPSLGEGDFWNRDPPSGESLDGYRLLASTRAKGIPTVVVSGVAMPDDIESAYAKHGLFAYLRKQTFDRRTFLQTVQEAQTACRADSALDCLTEREREVLALLAQGMTNKEIAAALVITTNTVKRHVKSVFAKLDVHTRSAATAKAVGLQPQAV
ncbi:MAG: response regulator [Anaerolineae bacterium]|nr:response regulator [Anaerolineae bacterium]